MSDEYEITSIKLKNYRQYYDQVTVNMIERDKGFTVFLGENGEGKSNLLNAINWCMYGKEPHTRKSASLPIINTKHLEEAPLESTCEVMVELMMKKNESRYVIRRTLKATKHGLEERDVDGSSVYTLDDQNGLLIPKGLEVFNIKREFDMLDGNSAYKPGNLNFDAHIMEILPENLSRFFILDGEFLENLFDKFEEIKKGVHQIAQVDLLGEVAENIKDIVRKNPKGLSEEIEELNKQIRNIENHLESRNDDGTIRYSHDLRWNENDGGKCYVASGEARLKDLKTDSENITQEYNETQQEIENIGAESMQKLSQDEKEQESEIDYMLKTNTNQECERVQNLVKKGPIIFLKDAISDAIDMISKEEDRGGLPNKIKRIFADDLLTVGKCLCGNDLHINHKARKNIENMRDRLSNDVDVDIALNIRFENKNALENYGNVLKDIDDARDKYETSNESYKNAQKRLKLIRSKMEKTGNNDHVELLVKRDNLRKTQENINREIGNLEYEIKYKKNELRNMQHSRSKLNVRDKRTRIFQHNRKIWEDTKTTIDGMVISLEEDLREKIQNTMTEYFKQIMYKDDFDRITINENFNLRLLKTDRWDVTGSLSAGERLFMALSFIAALRKVTGYLFPLIIDTPLGRVSSTPRELLGKKLPGFLEESQIILLATDTEYMAQVNKGEKNGKTMKELLNENVKTTEYRIRYDTKNRTSTIKPISTIEEHN
ncbi:MAG: DNA sulfur modification protein DndD [Cenarchaeum symbiont of Oopsacas minuta]|nr:DNA sulfur modification protein DndD [Cenarchaeum symbiont of Oopsacas minuta]